MEICLERGRFNYVARFKLDDEIRKGVLNRYNIASIY